MMIIHLRRTRGGTSTAERPMAEPSGSPVEVLFAKAKRRERRRRAIALGVLLALGGLAFGDHRCPPPCAPRRPGNAASSREHTRAAQEPPVKVFHVPGPIGIGGATFGQPEAVAIAELDKVLGSPATPRPGRRRGELHVSAYLALAGDRSSSFTAASPGPRRRRDRSGRGVRRGAARHCYGRPGG